MDNKINFYGYEMGVLLEKSDEEFDFYSQNNKALDYGFYNEDNGFFLEKDYQENLKYVRNYVEDGVNGTYGIISFQGRIEIGGEEYNDILKGEYSIDNMKFDFFKDLASIEYSICKKDNKIIEYFLEDEIKKLVASKIGKDCLVDTLHITERAKYCIKASEITTLEGLLETPLNDLKNLKNIGKKAYPSIREELGRICHEVVFQKELDTTNKFVELEEDLDGIEK